MRYISSWRRQAQRQRDHAVLENKHRKLNRLDPHEIEHVGRGHVDLYHVVATGTPEFRTVTS
jgi:hypothetical protein